MSKNKVKSPVWCDASVGCIGRAARSREGGLQWPRAASFLRNQQRATQIFSYTGPPNVTLNHPGDGTTTAEYYVIHWLKNNNDFDITTRKVAYAMKLWQGCTEGLDHFIRFYPDYTSGTYTTKYSSYISSALSEDFAVWGDQCRGGMRIWTADQPIACASGLQPTAPRFSCARISVQNAMVAAVGVFSVPENEEDSNEIYREWHSDPGQHIRGRYEYPDRDNIASFGTLRSTICSTNPARDTVEAATQRCLFQTGHPVGWVYRNAGANTYLPLHGDFEFPVYPRNTMLEDNPHSLCYLAPAFVVSGEEGFKVKYTIGTEVMEWTAAAGYDKELITPYHATNPCDFIPSPMEADIDRTCKIEIAPDEDLAEYVQVHTVSLWEYLPYPYVAPGPS